MNKFKVGDKIRYAWHGDKLYGEIIRHCRRGSLGAMWVIRLENGSRISVYECNLELIQ